MSYADETYLYQGQASDSDHNDHLYDSPVAQRWLLVARQSAFDAELERYSHSSLEQKKAALAEHVLMTKADSEGNRVSLDIIKAAQSGDGYLGQVLQEERAAQTGVCCAAATVGLSVRHWLLHQ
ncbi:hypothetical protein ACWNG8_06855 [Aeromonas veronii]